jgi:hypothetical protein
MLEETTLTLSRATIDTYQGVCLAEGNDNISYTTFFRAREPWSKSMIAPVVELV